LHTSLGNCLLGTIALSVIVASPISTFKASQAYAAGPPNFSPTFKQDEICEPGDRPGVKIVNKKALATSLIKQAGALSDVFFGNRKLPDNSAFAGQEPWTRVFTDPSFCVEMGCSSNALDEPSNVGSDTGAVKSASAVLPSQTYWFRLLQSYVSMPDGLIADPNFRSVGPPPRNASDFLNPAASAAQLACVPAPRDIIGTFIQPFRLRGYPGQIAGVPTPVGVTSSPPADDFHANQLYFPNQGAQLGVKSNQGNPATSSLVGALGYQIDVSQFVQPHTFIVPYVAIDRETNTKKKSASDPAPPPFSPNTFDSGVVLQTYVPMPASISETISGQNIALRPDYLWNWADGSQLASVNLDYILLGTKYLNQYTQLLGSSKIYGMLQVDMLAQAGFFTMKGHPTDLALNQNFARFGGAVGPAIELLWVPDNPIDLSATYTDFLAPEGFHKSLGLFQSGITWNFGPRKLIGVAATYINGRQLGTAQRIQQWSIGLSLRY
jgi:hypothetical protein